MPLFGMQTTLVNNANRALAATFFPRYRKQMWPLIGAALPPSHRYVEPFSFPGAAPMLSRWNGEVLESALNSFKLQVPMQLFKNKGKIARQDLEFDQIGVIPKTFEQYGAALAETPDYALASKILRGHTAGIATETSDVDGQTYNATFEPAVPLFSANHTYNGKGSTQSNIVTGSLPSTTTALYAQDNSTTVQQIQQDLGRVIDLIASWTDDKGRILFPNLKSEEDLVVVGPPVLKPGFELAFKIAGAIAAGTGGTSGGSGSSNVVANRLVKEAATWSLLRGCPDVYDPRLGTISPSNALDYYVCIKNDFVQPAYWMPFSPPKGDNFIPQGYDPEAEAVRIVEQAKEDGVDVSPLAASAYASAIIDHNLNAIGDKAQEGVVDQEQFFLSARQRGNWVLGPWFTWIKVVPSGVAS